MGQLKIRVSPEKEELIEIEIDPHSDRDSHLASIHAQLLADSPYPSEDGILVLGETPLDVYSATAFQEAKLRGENRLALLMFAIGATIGSKPYPDKAGLELLKTAHALVPPSIDSSSLNSPDLKDCEVVYQRVGQIIERF